MKKIKQTQANGFYIFHGEVAANSNFIETVNEAKQFLIYANFFLKDYLTIYEYVITRHEWHIVVKLKSKKEIFSREVIDEGSQVGPQEIWRIVSERIRLFLSTYVKCINRMRGRTGTLVHSSYERYYFESLQEAKETIEALREQTWRFYKRKRKYRGKKKHYSIPKRLGNGSIFLCSKEVKSDTKRRQNFLESQYLSELTDLVLSGLVKNCIKVHSSPPSTKPTSKNQHFHPH